MNDLNEKQILKSWHANAKAWADAIQNQAIESRNLVTNDAILDAVFSCKPVTVLDVGCGEGWLTRSLVALGLDVTGVDVVPELINIAKQRGAGKFQLCSYETITNELLGKEDKGRGAKYDAVVCNFSLIGKESVEQLLNAVPALLSAKGYLLIQTLHPLMACIENDVDGDSVYEDGWRSGSWIGFGPEFKDPAPWYFRTLESWSQLLGKSGLRILELREPLHPLTKKPASLIFICASSA